MSSNKYLLNANNDTEYFKQMLKTYNSYMLTKYQFISSTFHDIKF